MNPYESEKLLHEYLLFHYGGPEEILEFDFGPVSALHFAVRTVSESASRLPGFFQEGGEPETQALDLGCAVGRSSFELSRYFAQVLGIDFSQAFVKAAEALRTRRELPYQKLEEGEITSPLVARLPETAHPERVRFQQGDACKLPDDLGPFDLVHGANLLCRLPEPQALLDRLPTLVKKGGALILATPATWLEDYTPKDRWLGGRVVEGQARTTLESLLRLLSPHFRLRHYQDLPFLIRETRRKFQWTVSQLSVWQRV
ncbi:MAG: putative 4-mercaptohistidine N1-methyltransferase [Verrucomicrobiota bacterium]